MCNTYTHSTSTKFCSADMEAWIGPKLLRGPEGPPKKTYQESCGQMHYVILTG